MRSTQVTGLVAACCFCLPTICRSADAPSPAAAAEPKPIVLETPDGVRFGIWPTRPQAPAPVLFILSGPIEDALGTETFRKAGNLLGPKGYLCVSVDLPCHGADATPDENSLKGWRVRSERGEDVVADLTGRLRKVLDYLIAEKLADPEYIAACGTSRGGFMALHFAASDPRVRCVAAYAPVADLAALTEFKGAEENPLVKKIALVNQADALAGRAVWIVIGNHDLRVDTDRTIALARSINKSAQAQKLPSRVDLLVLQAEGHRCPDGAVETSAAWIEQNINPRP